MHSSVKNWTLAKKDNIYKMHRYYQRLVIDCLEYLEYLKSMLMLSLNLALGDRVLEERPDLAEIVSADGIGKMFDVVLGAFLSWDFNALALSTSAAVWAACLSSPSSCCAAGDGDPNALPFSFTLLLALPRPNQKKT